MLWVYYLAASASDRDTLHPRPEMPYHGRVVSGHGHTASALTIGCASGWGQTEQRAPTSGAPSSGGWL